MLKNVIAKYCFNGSTVYGCFLDASKAFDRVDHTSLFKKLLDRKVPPVVVRVLLSWYVNQRASVLWNKCLSQKFSGVWQGGVLSRILFTIYIDDLLVAPEQKVFGNTLLVLSAMQMTSLSLHHHILLYVTCLQLALYMLILTL